jgi:dihydrodipicolinate synthase/N-acetylneuraminate lyase
MPEAAIRGTLAAAVTPLRDGGQRLDEAAFAPLVEFYAAGGVDGLLMLGTTGEGVLLAREERRRAAELMIGGSDALPVLVHCGAQTTAETCALAADAAEAGAFGAAVIAPPYFAFAAGELLAHFAAAAAACAPLPFYIYEYADRSGYSIPVNVIEELRGRASNLVGMKISDAPFERVEPYLATGLDVFIGAEAVIPEGLSRGAVGAVSGLAAAFPEVVAALVSDPTPAHSARADTLRAVLGRRPFQAAVKAALGLRGVPVGPDVRGPLLPLSRSEIADLRAELESVLGTDALARAAAV